MKTAQILLVLFTIPYSVFGQSIKTFELGFYLNTLYSMPKLTITENSAFNDISISNSFGGGIGFGTIYNFNNVIGARAQVGVEFYTNKLAYNDNGENISNDIETTPVFVSAQIHLNPIEDSGFTIFSGYSFNMVETKPDGYFYNNLRTSWSSVEFGFGYRFEVNDVSVMPEIEYSHALSSIWLQDSTDLGMAITELKINVISLTVTLYSTRYKQKTAPNTH